MSEPKVYIVDDDPACRDSLALLLELRGIRSESCAVPEQFFERFEPGIPACVLLDYRMPSMTGLEVQSEMVRRGWQVPVIILSAHGDVATTRQALKAGALDFIEKPVDSALLLDVIEQALARAQEDIARAAREEAVARRVERLTPRERDVLRAVLSGMQNREIGTALGISPRTVEVYKARVMLKLEAERVSDLIRFCADLPGLTPR
ncbi:MAG: response regulator transcription factor [Gammaproteobacteria bacterium]